ncbi:MAG: tRNA pseudouridine synthase A [Saprospiraceae bacterium]
MTESPLLPRYFMRLAYDGTEYSGWQRQPKDVSIQQIFEEKLSMILRQRIYVLGCGRTDAGVHALDFYLHFDADLGQMELPELLRRLNHILPKDIAAFEIFPVKHNANVRFSAYSRSYIYKVSTRKDPFLKGKALLLHRPELFDKGLMQQAADLLLRYTEFYPFCKSNTDVKTMTCKITEARWEWRDEIHSWEFHITANRFLRGMVRMIVGMCLEVGQGKMSLAEIEDVMERQVRLPRPLSVSGHGLYLRDILYPDDIRI